MYVWMNVWRYGHDGFIGVGTSVAVLASSGPERKGCRHNDEGRTATAPGNGAQAKAW